MTHIIVNQLCVEFPIITRGLGAIRNAPDSQTDARFRRLKSGQTVMRALDSICFELLAGDRLGLVGSNGAGKSTLLLALAGIYEPSMGTIETEGQVEALFNPRLGFRIEATGRRNIQLRGLLRGWTNSEIDAAMDDIITFSELGHFIDMPLKSYSQGMAARLAFALSTAFAPDVLLMDEWIGAGDRSFQDKARKRMDSFVTDAGIIIIASHNQGLLKRLCNKALHLENGKVEAFGVIDDVL